MKKPEASATWLSPQEEPAQTPRPRRRNDAVLITPARAAEIQRLAQEAYGLQPPVLTPKRKERGEEKMLREIKEAVNLAVMELDSAINGINQQIAGLRPGRSHTILFDEKMKPRADQHLPQPGSPQEIQALENEVTELMKQRLALREGLEAIQSGSAVPPDFSSALRASAATTRIDSLKKNLKAMATLAEHGAFKGAA